MSSQVLPLPKYAHAALSRIFKNSIYTDLINAYPQNTERLYLLLDKEKQTFSTVRTLSILPSFG
jgi:hypothetical protein